jgi:hypothetical protein
MAKNTGRGTRAGAITGRVRELPSPQWVDINSREWVVWHEGGEVIVYEGEREVATRRRVMTSSEARIMANLLLAAAAEAAAPAE